MPREVSITQVEVVVVTGGRILEGDSAIFLVGNAVFNCPTILAILSSSPGVREIPASDLDRV